MRKFWSHSYLQGSYPRNSPIYPTGYENQINDRLKELRGYISEDDEEPDIDVQSETSLIKFFKENPRIPYQDITVFNSILSAHWANEDSDNMILRFINSEQVRIAGRAASYRARRLLERAHKSEENLPQHILVKINEDIEKSTGDWYINDAILQLPEAGKLTLALLQRMGIVK